MNELIFILHIVSLAIFILLAAMHSKQAVVAISVIQAVLINLFVTKQITLFSLSVTPTDAYSLSLFFTLNVARELFGKNFAKKLIVINVLSLLFFVFASIIQVWYEPSPHDVSQEAFKMLLGSVPRIFISSVVCYYVSQYLDYMLFGYFRGKSSFTVSMVLSLSISQLLDTVLFSIIALYGVVYSITTIILVSYFVKMLALVLLVPTLSLTKIVKSIRFEKKGLDV